MAVYEWRGITTAGKEVKGTRDADNPRVLRTTLRKDGILVTEVLEESEARVKKATSAATSVASPRSTSRWPPGSSPPCSRAACRSWSRSAR